MLTTADLHAAIEDYLVRGWRCHADPGPEFNSRYYLIKYGDAADAGINPLLHYLKTGRNEGRCPRPPWVRRDAVAPTDADWEALSATFRHPDVEPEVDVVVPVCRGLNESMRCLFSVLTAKQETPLRLIVIDGFYPGRKPRPPLRVWLYAV